LNIRSKAISRAHGEAFVFRKEDRALGRMYRFLESGTPPTFDGREHGPQRPLHSVPRRAASRKDGLRHLVRPETGALQTRRSSTSHAVSELFGAKRLVRLKVGSVRCEQWKSGRCIAGSALGAMRRHMLRGGNLGSEAFHSQWSRNGQKRTSEQRYTRPNGQRAMGLSVMRRRFRGRSTTATGGHHG
jgi:hypothetical protein